MSIHINKTAEEHAEERQIVAMQRAACAARGGNRRWCLPTRYESDEVES